MISQKTINGVPSYLIQEGIEYLKYRIKNLEEKLENLPNDKDKGSLSGMIIKYQSQLRDLEPPKELIPSQYLEIREKIIEYLIEKGFKFNAQHGILIPEFVFLGKNRKLRIRIQELKLVILLDSGCTYQIRIKNIFYNPNSAQIDYAFNDLTEIKKSIDYFMNRANDLLYDLSVLNNPKFSEEERRSLIRASGYDDSVINSILK